MAVSALCFLLTLLMALPDKPQADVSDQVANPSISCTTPLPQQGAAARVVVLHQWVGGFVGSN